ncbi:hypothetical protein HAX54_049779 [Datura stramonium]|uniref:Uncharacterized protein n=1 Tax=Datura stramonium TaxID=4076 RepID=A0ABS8SVZ3_DATST|nr:hypothetical protein [Datura stramonium]
MGEGDFSANEKGIEMRVLPCSLFSGSLLKKKMRRRGRSGLCGVARRVAGFEGRKWRFGRRRRGSVGEVMGEEEEGEAGGRR